MNKVYLSLGSNRGNRSANLERAITLLSEWAGDVVTVSSVYETPPWQMTDKTNFFNQVLLLETAFDPAQLIDTIILVETMMGRKRTGIKYEPRIIDIDILFYNDAQINTEELTIPHPLIAERRFVLEPLTEIAPGFMYPLLKKTVTQLRDECEDKSKIKKLASK